MATIVDVTGCSSAPDLLLLPLSLNFRKAQAYYNDVDGTSLSGNDPKLQEQVTQGLALCEAALQQVTAQSIFSQNELVDDLNTGDLRYLLLPLYRGELLLRVTDQSRREALLGEALACLRGFLDDLMRLEVLPREVARSLEAQSEGAGPTDLATLRDLKVARFRANKINKARMEVLAGRLRRAGQTEEEEEDGEEIEREHMLLLIGCCTHTALDSIRAAEQEHDMLKQVAELRLPDGTVPRAPPEPREAGGGLRVLSVMPQAGGVAGQPSMPQVGAGGVAQAGGGGLLGTWEEKHGRVSYANAMQQIHTGEIPGLYTYTIEEWLRQEEAERALKEAQGMDEMGQRSAAKELAKEEREYDVGDGEEDLEDRRKLIAQDDFRETCKRGSGNRHNRS